MADEWEYEASHDPVLEEELLRRARRSQWFDPPKTDQEVAAYVSGPQPAWRGIFGGIDEVDPATEPPISAGYLKLRYPMGSAGGATILEGYPGPYVPGKPVEYSMWTQEPLYDKATRYVANLMGFGKPKQIPGTDITRETGSGLRSGLRWSHEDILPYWERTGVRKIRFEPELSKGASEKFGAGPRVRTYEMATHGKAERIGEPLSPNSGGMYEIELPLDKIRAHVKARKAAARKRKQ